jgi:aryl-alcohol dehydrogenase-like predicted oxidoreductase
MYLLHRDIPEVDVGPIVEVLNRLHCEGKIGAFGGSNWTHQRIAAANEYAAKHHLTPFSVSSPFFSLADQREDPWGGGCISIAGPNNQEARKWYIDNQMPVIAYSSLGRGMLSGLVKSKEPENAANVLDPVALKGYCFPDNFERLSRVEKLAAEKGCSIPQIAMAWVLNQPMNTFAISSPANAEQMETNIEALNTSLTPEEMLYLDLKTK